MQTLGLLAWCITGCQPSCGDGHRDRGEECDLGARNGSDSGCTVECREPRCGDGIVQPDEVCDDGNRDPKDGCDECSICGDGLVTGPETCDDSNTDNDDGCAYCQLPGHQVWSWDRIGERCDRFLQARDGELIVSCFPAVILSYEIATQTWTPFIDLSSYLVTGRLPLPWVLPDGGFVIEHHDVSSSFLTRLDPSGARLWGLTVPVEGRFGLGGLVALPDGTLVAVGRSGPEDGNSDTGVILHIDDELGVILHQVVDPDAPVFSGLAMTSDGLLASGYGRLYDRGLMARVTPEGSWETLYYGLSDEEVSTGLVGSGSRLRALVIPRPRSFSVPDYFASVGVDASGPTEEWRLELQSGGIRLLEGGWVSYGDRPSWLARHDADTLETMWQAEHIGMAIKDAIRASDGLLYAIGYASNRSYYLGRFTW